MTESATIIGAMREQENFSARSRHASGAKTDWLPVRRAGDNYYLELSDLLALLGAGAAGTGGRYAYVTDGDASLAWGATVVNLGGGATKYLVWDNGSAWTVVGK